MSAADDGVPSFRFPVSGFFRKRSLHGDRDFAQEAPSFARLSSRFPSAAPALFPPRPRRCFLNGPAPCVQPILSACGVPFGPFLSPRARMRDFFSTSPPSANRRRSSA
jgi:hypothetical protein